VARQCELLLVVGSTNSSNSNRLVEVAEREGCPARLIDDETQLDPAWLAGVDTVGLTAGASAPPWIVEVVLAALAGLGPLEVVERSVATESVHFALPPKLR
jgi:4-hydroxy-3-methylbut-2-enyl diphosphate reductase